MLNFRRLDVLTLAKNTKPVKLNKDSSETQKKKTPTKKQTNPQTPHIQQANLNWLIAIYHFSIISGPHGIIKHRNQPQGYTIQRSNFSLP